MQNSDKDKFDFSSLLKPDVFLNLAWWHFQRQIPDYEAAIEYLASKVEKMGLMKCLSCGCEDLTRKYGQRNYKCNTCKKRHSFTSGTIFEGIKLIYAWAGRIWLLDLGIILTSSPP